MGYRKATKGKRGRRTQRGFRVIPFSKSLSLATLGSDTVLTGDLTDEAFSERYQIISVDAYVMKRGGTVNQGPLLLGYNHSDLTVAEIKEALINSDVSLDNITAMEQATRPVRKMGMFSQIVQDEVMNDGKPKRTRIGFSIGPGFALQLFVMNKSGSGLTTGTVVLVDGNIYCRRM